jgi:hypothetical protein
MRKRYFLYEIVNLVTKASYVGVTHDWRARIESHFERSSNWRLRAAIEHFGRDKFRPRCIGTFHTLQRVLEAEIDEIERRKDSGWNLYNESEGGEHPWGQNVRLEDFKLQRLVKKAYRMVKNDPSDVRQFKLQPHVPLSQKETVSNEKAKIVLREVRQADGRLTKMLQLVQRLGEKAYYGTDRMSSEDARWWAEHKGPILKMAELNWKLSTSPSNWPDREVWAEALPEIEAKRLCKENGRWTSRAA